MTSIKILIQTVITEQGSKKLEKDGKRLQDEFATLKAAIEEAIIKGQKSLGDLNNIPGSDLVPNGYFAFTCMNAGSDVVGWVDDF